MRREKSWRGRKRNSGSPRRRLRCARLLGLASENWQSPAPARAAAFAFAWRVRSTAGRLLRPWPASAGARERRAHQFCSARECGASALCGFDFRRPYTRASSREICLSVVRKGCQKRGGQNVIFWRFEQVAVVCFLRVTRCSTSGVWRFNIRVCEDKNRYEALNLERGGASNFCPSPDLIVDILNLITSDASTRLNEIQGFACCEHSIFTTWPRRKFDRMRMPD